MPLCFIVDDHGDTRDGFAEYLRERGALDLSECFIDGTFVAVKKGEVM